MDRNWDSISLIIKGKYLMHEAYLAQTIINIVNNEIKSKQESIKIKNVYVKIGILHAVIPESLQLFFNIIKKEHKALKEATLIIEKIPIQIFCPLCHKTSIIEEPNFLCTNCNHPVKIKQGQELLVSSIDLDE